MSQWLRIAFVTFLLFGLLAMIIVPALQMRYGVLLGGKGAWVVWSIAAVSFVIAWKGGDVARSVGRLLSHP